SILSCKKEITLSLSQTSIVLSGPSATKNVDVYCNGAWSTQTPDWLVCEPASGDGNATVKVSVADDSGFSQSGSILFLAEGQTASVTVKLSGEDFIMSSDSFHFDENGTPQKATIKSHYDWTISIPKDASWITVEPMSGKAGETEITLTPKPITDRKPRTEQIIDVSYGTKFSMFVVSQTMPNNAPEAPVLVSPVNEEGVAIDVVFKWNAAKDSDSDILTYQLKVTEDGGKTWLTATVENATETKLPELLSINRDYTWQVTVSDPFGGYAESATATFRTGDDGAWKNKEFRVIQDATAGAPKPVNLLIMGDGYIDSDYIEGAKFDQDLQRAYQSFFSLEPFKSYKDYFRVTALAAYSEERGATVKQNIPEYPDGVTGGCPKQTRNTLFNSTLDGGSTTAVTCNYDRVFEYAKTVDGIDDNELQNMTILLMINLDVYAGTCVSFRSGQSIAMSPVGKGTFETIVNHECGGHGFARVLDEYVYYSSETIPPTDRGVQQISEWRKYDPYYANNIDLTGSRTDVHWKKYYDHTGYSSVGLYEGSMMYGKGVWRSEIISCMCDNRKYYNAPTREAIVYRIMKVAGLEFNFDDFVAKDKVKSDDTGVAIPPEYGGTKAGPILSLPPLAPPICIDE
ncbi:MAG: M64 family metallopeptidase, partial [Candidatus Cryptobacteroides sp.]